MSMFPNTLKKSSAKSDSEQRVEQVTEVHRPSAKFFITFLQLASILGLFAYSRLFWLSLKGYWFNPEVTTDDALQQSFVFHSIKYPGIFESDLIAQAMKSYLAPLHYGASYAATWLSGDPIMGGHWVMFLQLAISLAAIFFAAKRLGGLVPACFSVVWFLHSRLLVQRLTGGLPRGWAAPILTATICFTLYGNHYAVLFVLFLGCLSNPPSTIIAALFYGLVLCVRSVRPGQSCSITEARGRLKQYILLSPAYIAVTYFVTKPPEFFGTMISYSEALKNPAMSIHGGRFAFVPFLPIWDEVRREGFLAFISPFEHTPEAIIQSMPYLVIGLCTLLGAFAVALRKRLLPAEMLLYVFSVVAVYLASRQIAFYLYVPDRHLRLPLGFFFILALPAALWCSAVCGSKYPSWKRSLLGVVLFGGLAAMIYSGSALGLRGDANFNVNIHRKAGLFTWLHEVSAPEALVAGHPSHIDDTMLLAVRRAFITAETAHPFFDGYYREVERRLRIVWSAYYATDVLDFYRMLRAENIDYFVFRRNDFRRHTLAQATYYQPFTEWVRNLASKDPSEYVFHNLPRGEPNGPNPVLPFRDRYSIVVDVHQLGVFLGEEVARTG